MPESNIDRTTYLVKHTNRCADEKRNENQQTKIHTCKYKQTTFEFIYAIYGG